MLRDARVQYDVSHYEKSIYATREYTTTNDEKYSIYVMREYTTIFDLYDTYYSLLERYMKHVFVAGLVTGDFCHLPTNKHLKNCIIYILIKRCDRN